jgi:hypothetical protein
LTGVLRLILIIIVIYYAFSLLFRYILPQVLKHSLQNFQQGYQQDHFEQYQQRKEGEVTIHIVGEKQKNKDAQHDNEYIDYEDVK